MTKRDRAAWIKAAGAECLVRPPPAERPLRFVLLGAPGVGKGTQAELLGERLGVCPLSTGDVFRAAKTSGNQEHSPALRKALEAMRRGELVSDDTVLEIVKERTKCLRCHGGFLLDGFPRTVAQAEALEQLLAAEHIRLDAVINYELPIETLVARLSGRRTCQDCKAVFHVVTLPPRVTGICDRCGAKLFERDDDRPDSVRVRMELYERNAALLADYYRKRELLLSVPAEGTPEEIFWRLAEALEARQLVAIAPDLCI